MRFIHVVGVAGLLLVIIQHMGTLQLFTLSPGDGYLDHSSITVNILVHVFVGYRYSLLCGTYLGVELLGHRYV